MNHAPIKGAVFHALLRDCLQAQRAPRESEIQLVACKIWQDSCAARTKKDWHDLIPGSREYDYALRAARMAFGLPPVTTAA